MDTLKGTYKKWVLTSVLLLVCKCHFRGADLDCPHHIESDCIIYFRANAAQCAGGKYLQDIWRTQAYFNL